MDLQSIDALNGPEHSALVVACNCVDTFRSSTAGQCGPGPAAAGCTLRAWVVQEGGADARGARGHKRLNRGLWRCLQPAEGKSFIKQNSKTMRVNWRIARQATDLVLPPVLALWVGALAWVYRSHYLVEWHHQGTNADDPACRHLAQWVRDKSTCHITHMHTVVLL
jgi:hypothetical protein